jgi:WD40 repeat protein
MKFLDDNKRAVFCNNSETLKIINIENGIAEMYQGHTDIIISVDYCKGYIISGAKDNEIRLWKFVEDAEMFQKIKCLAVF